MDARWVLAGLCAIAFAVAAQTPEVSPLEATSCYACHQEGAYEPPMHAAIAIEGLAINETGLKLNLSNPWTHEIQAYVADISFAGHPNASTEAPIETRWSTEFESTTHALESEPLTMNLELIGTVDTTISVTPDDMSGDFGVRLVGPIHPDLPREEFSIDGGITIDARDLARGGPGTWTLEIHSITTDPRPIAGSVEVVEVIDPNRFVSLQRGPMEVTINHGLTLEAPGPIEVSLVPFIFWDHETGIKPEDDERWVIHQQIVTTEPEIETQETPVAEEIPLSLWVAPVAMSLVAARLRYQQ